MGTEKNIIAKYIEHKRPRRRTSEYQKCLKGYQKVKTRMLPLASIEKRMIKHYISNLQQDR